MIEQLTRVLPASALVFGEDVRRRSGNVWGTPKPTLADVLIRPATTGELSQALAICHELSHPVVIQGGQTGVVGSTATQPGDVILSLERMSTIEEVDTIGQTITAQAGVTLQRAQEAASEHGMLLGLDLGARGTATLGGNASTNAGGNRVIRYGMTRRHVLGLEAVLADGTVLSPMNKVIKDNAGYDLKQMFIGSEGTLGVISRLVLQLLPAPKTTNTAMVAASSFDCVAQLLVALNAQLGGSLSAFEVMWCDYYRLVTTPPAKSRAPLAQGRPFYVLLESYGADEGHDGERFADALSNAMDSHMIEDAVIARTSAERSALWALRDDVHQLLRFKPLFLFDVSLPITLMEAYVYRVGAQLKALYKDARLFVFGHLGDGNLHICISAGSEDGSNAEEIENLVYTPLGPIHGSVSAEHGIGLDKKPYLSVTRSPAEIELMRRLKRLLDPHNILNRGRVIDV